MTLERMPEEGGFLLSHSVGNGNPGGPIRHSPRILLALSEIGFPRSREWRTEQTFPEPDNNAGDCYNRYFLKSASSLRRDSAAFWAAFEDLDPSLNLK